MRDAAEIRDSQFAEARTGSELRYRKLIGEDDWRTLNPAIRRRFRKGVFAGGSTVYCGVIRSINMNRWGRILSWLCRSIGSPLPVERDVRDLPAIVTITEDRAGPGQFWTLVYGRRKGFPQIIHSAKRFCGPTGLEDYIGYGFGILLSVSGRKDALIFTSAGYFLSVLGRRFRLPKIVTPGRLEVGHYDLGAGRFVFTMDLDHPWFGKMIRQTISFCETKEIRPEPSETGLEYAV